LNENNKKELTIEEVDSLLNAVSPPEEKKSTEVWKDLTKGEKECISSHPIREDNGIKAGVNVDYHKIMDEANFNYADWYENMMNKRGCSFSLPLEILEKLSKKRKFGIEKYGDKSFQASFEASMTSPVKEHAKEEFIDALNYLLHMHFILETSFVSLKDIHLVDQAINHIDEAIELLDKIEAL